MKTIKRSIAWILVLIVIFTFTSLNVFAASDVENGSVSEKVIGGVVGPLSYEQCPYWLDGHHHMVNGIEWTEWRYTGYNVREYIVVNGLEVGYILYGVYEEYHCTNYYCACGYDYDVSYSTGRNSYEYIETVYY